MKIDVPDWLKRLKLLKKKLKVVLKVGLEERSHTVVSKIQIVYPLGMMNVLSKHAWQYGCCFFLIFLVRVENLA